MCSKNFNFCLALGISIAAHFEHVEAGPFDFGYDSVCRCAFDDREGQQAEDYDQVGGYAD